MAAFGFVKVTTPAVASVGILGVTLVGTFAVTQQVLVVGAVGADSDGSSGRRAGSRGELTPGFHWPTVWQSPQWRVESSPSVCSSRCVEQLRRLHSQAERRER